MWYRFKPYVPVAQRRAKAAREVAKRTKTGQAASPVVIAGRTITETFWGKAWCRNLESYSDYANRLPRGRTYVRNGSVVDLQILAGKITALVSGSSLYKIEIVITPVADPHWQGVKSRCAGQIGSLIELLQGRLSKSVMDIVTARDDGLFPKPSEIKMNCSCPDWAGMCKHLAAVMYGVGARLDQQPELLFLLRKLDHLELIENALPTMAKKGKGTTLVDSELADVFGIELAPVESPEAPPVEETSQTKRHRRAGAAPKTKRVQVGAGASERAKSATQTRKIKKPLALKMPKPKG